MLPGGIPGMLPNGKDSIMKERESSRSFSCVFSNENVSIMIRRVKNTKQSEQTEESSACFYVDGIDKFELGCYIDQLITKKENPNEKVHPL